MTPVLDSSVLSSFVGVPSPAGEFIGGKQAPTGSSTVPEVVLSTRSDVSPTPPGSYITAAAPSEVSPTGSPSPKEKASPSPATRDQAQDDDAYMASLMAFSSPPASVKARIISRAVSSILRRPSAESGETASDATVGADYALQSGGAAPESQADTKQDSSILSRCVSLGSIASGVTGLEDVTPGWDKIRPFEEPSLLVGPAIAEEKSTQAKPGNKKDVPLADGPGARSRSNSGKSSSSGHTLEMGGQKVKAPKETVMAQNVQKVHVPAAVVREYQENNPSPLLYEKRLDKRTGHIASGKGLSLREHSSTIDRLQKENFDLKLKVYYLDKALNERSDESVQETLAQNVELKVAVSTMHKQNQELRKKVSDLETALKAKENQASRPGSEKSDDSSKVSRSTASRQTEQEIVYLREQVKRYEKEITHLKDAASRKPGVHQSTSHSRKASEDKTLLRIEIEELKRETVAQAAMLTSRNRERERLYNEIEDLKLHQLRGERVSSTTGDSRRDRAGLRGRAGSGSRTSGDTATTVLSDVERSLYEHKLGQLRGEVSHLKLSNQELEKRLGDCLDDLEHAEMNRLAREKEFELELNVVARELRHANRDREQAATFKLELEADYENLKREAQQEMGNMEAELERSRAELRQVKRDLSNRSDSFNALQTEMRSLSEVVLRLEDDQRARSRQVRNLQEELHDAHGEMASLERSLREANAKIERYTVQQESTQNEIAFLREEQDADKIKIGDLESALKGARGSVEKLETQIRDEKHEHDVAIKDLKQEAEKRVDEVRHQLAGAEEECQRLRKMVTTTEAEAIEWKNRFHEFEDGLSAALGEQNGTDASLIRVSPSL